MIRQFDLWFLEEILEKYITHPLERLTGKDCFWFGIAVLAFAGSFVFFVGGYMALRTFLSVDSSEFLPYLGRWGTTVMVIFFLATGFLGSFFIVLPEIGSWVDQIRDATYRGLRNGFKNPEKIHYWKRIIAYFFFLTLFCIVFNPIFLSFLTSPSIFIYCISVLIIVFSATFSFALISCDPLPPGADKSKIKQWIEKARDTVLPKPKLAPAPSL